MSIGPYTASEGRKIDYVGNRIFKPVRDVKSYTVPVQEIEARPQDLAKDPMWSSISRINHRVNAAANEYFDKIGSLFTLLPLTTRMISSPGAVYGKNKISYTTDTAPIKLRWFDLEREAFLSESSQIYLELALLQGGVDKVYSIYNSFRQEKADATHLSEFHHIEFEGKVSQEENLKVAYGLTRTIIKELLEKNEGDMLHFLYKDDLSELEQMSKAGIKKVKFADVIEQLRQVDPDLYKGFTMKEFGSWEEVKATEMNGGMLAVTEFPLFEVPFYHAPVLGKTPLVAENADVIWPGYREFIGSGHRVRNAKELESKADAFDLPRSDYEPYLWSRQSMDYAETSGFGMGWERLLQGLLKTPFIWTTSQFPRIDKTLKP